jgi:hypothetical protein
MDWLTDGLRDAAGPIVAAAAVAILAAICTAAYKVRRVWLTWLRPQVEQALSDDGKTFGQQIVDFVREHKEQTNLQRQMLKAQQDTNGKVAELQAEVFRRLDSHDNKLDAYNDRIQFLEQQRLRHLEKQERERG